MLIGAEHLSPKCQCVENTVFGCDEVTAVPLEVLVSVCWFSVNCGDLSVVRTRRNQIAQER